MFESDDFDQVLSQFDFPEVTTKASVIEDDIKKSNDSLDSNVEVSNILSEKSSNFIFDESVTLHSPNIQAVQKTGSPGSPTTPIPVSPKLMKRKMINSLFDQNSKRKFPGPAGLLTGSLEENNDQTICQIQLLSQDLEFSQAHHQKELFESPLWTRLLEDVKTWNMCEINAINTIKLQALAGNLQRRKAQTVTAFVETIDRSAVDPLIILRDATGSIKCTLHRDAWSTFSPYIVSDYCALVLWKPTVLTTGSAFKKHYLNITLSNIYAIYSSAVLDIEEKPLPDGYARIVGDFTLIKNLISPHNLGSEFISSNEAKIGLNKNDYLEELDTIFSDVF